MAIQLESPLVASVKPAAFFAIGATVCEKRKGRAACPDIVFRASKCVYYLYHHKWHFYFRSFHYVCSTTFFSAAFAYVSENSCPEKSDFGPVYPAAILIDSSPN
jgi:hypothetical protein